MRLARAVPRLGRLVIFEGLTHAFPSEAGWLTWLRRARDLERLVLLLDDLLGMRPQGPGLDAPALSGRGGARARSVFP